MEQANLDYLLDCEAIKNCLYRYTRGIDRGDVDVLRSAYWPDALDDHGSFVGRAVDFIDWVMAYQSAMVRSHHQIGNVLINIAGNKAEVESYFSASASLRDVAGTVSDLAAAGRYLDKFEKRGGQWKIANRLAVYDWHRSHQDTHAGQAQFGSAAKLGVAGKDDPSYAFFSSPWHRAII